MIGVSFEQQLEAANKELTPTVSEEEFNNFPSTIGSYQILQSLGQGSYGHVHAAINIQSHERFAIKRIRKANPKSQETLHHQQQKEIMIHKSLRHANIIRLQSVEETSDSYYLVLEIAAGGELFERIEPDYGLPAPIVHFYFVQLMHAVQYIHGLGIAHRDIKPENILLDSEGNLKLTDFGLGTVFFFRGKKRKLSTLCGTAVYLAPEVLTLNYDGDACDLWSCGVVLYVLLVGNTPWEEPTMKSEEFSRFVRSYPDKLDYPPWTQFDSSLKQLLLGLLSPNPTGRWDMEKIKSSSWFQLNNPFMDENGLCANSESLAQLLKEYRFGGLQQYRQLTQQYQGCEDPASQSCYGGCDETYPSLSQPEILVTHRGSAEVCDVSSNFMDVSFSQPVFENMSSSDQSMATKNVLGMDRNSLARNTHLLTRFYCAAGLQDIMSQITSSLEAFLVPFKRVQNNRVAFSTVDKRKCPLSGEIKVHPIPDRNQSIVVFERTKGDSIEFKRFFKIMLKECSGLVVDI